MATGVKRPIEWLIARSGLASAVGAARRPVGAILAYHNVVPTGEVLAGETSLHVDQQVFGQQLDLILERHDIVDVDTLMKPPSGERSRVAITFDDAYQGAMTVGLEELGRRGATGTVFVPPGCLEQEGFWWDQLAATRGGVLPDEVRNHALNELAGRQRHVTSWAEEQGGSIPELPEHARPLSEAGVLDRARAGDVVLGAHGWSHANLTALTAEELTAELDACREWLVQTGLDFADWLAYPYGLHDNGVVQATDERFVGGLRVDGGPALLKGTRPADACRTPRINVSRGVTPEGLALRLAGLLA